MNKWQLLKSLAPGFMPIIVFIVADSIWGMKIGLIIAITFGIAELIIAFIRDRVIDKFILLDIGLIICLGVISIILDNEIFFKLKPALIELVFVIIMGISLVSPVNIILLLSRRYLKNIEINREMEQQFGKSIKILFFIFLGHTILIVYSAFFMSKQAWAFVSGGLFYIMFIFYFVFELVKGRVKKKKWLAQHKDEEWFDIVDSEGKIIGRAPRGVCHSGPGKLHPVIHLHIFDSRDRIFLQKRSFNKEIQPGKWDTAVGGHIISGEDVKKALMREALEELGLREFHANFLEKYVWETDIESELVFLFYARYDKSLTWNKEEIDEGKFWKIKKIKAALGKNIFTPNFEFEFDLLLKKIFSTT